MSTAPSLAIDDDNVYRFVPPDTYQTNAMAYYLAADGITAVVPISRGDVRGDELEKLTAAAFARGNGTVPGGVRYAPDEENYAAMTADLDVRVGRAGKSDPYRLGLVGTGRLPVLPCGYGLERRAAPPKFERRRVRIQQK